MCWLTQHSGDAAQDVTSGERKHKNSAWGLQRRNRKGHQPPEGLFKRARLRHSLKEMCGGKFPGGDPV